MNGQQLKRKRKQYAMPTQRTFADALGMSLAAVKAWEADGVSTRVPKHVEKLFHDLDVLRRDTEKRVKQSVENMQAIAQEHPDVLHLSANDPLARYLGEGVRGSVLREAFERVRNVLLGGG